MVPWYNPATRYSRSAFTLVELLVVIAILGTLFAIVLSAVQASREAARATQCKNNLRQLSHALLWHDAAHQHLPSGGWSYRWLPEPGAGDFVFVTAEAAVVTDCVLIVPEWSNG